MPLKYAVNISTMFQEIPSLIARYSAAKNAGFKFVECHFPYEHDVESIAKALKDSEMFQVLINIFPGNYQAGDRGLAAITSKRREFMESVEISLNYAKALHCPNIHVMAGVQPSFQDAVWLEIYRENLRYAADRFQSEGITALIEAINSRKTMPKYYIDHPQLALECVKKIDHPNVKLLFDVFHCQIMDGNLTTNLKESLPYIGHIQIAQAPNRNEPGYPGEVNYKYILDLLEELGYDGYVGLEYFPTGDTVTGLKWLKDLNIAL